MAIMLGERIGAYEVTSQLGESDVGVVFHAYDTQLLRDVALKVLPHQCVDDPDRFSTLQREAQLLASVNHPNIAQVYGLEQIGNVACVVMELVEGETLADKLKNGPLPLDEALEISKQIADALAAAHERGIVYRDLNPANIKLLPNGTVKVLAFDLAKTLGSCSSESDLSTLPTKMYGSVDAVVGTVAYMSPEQAQGKEVDTRTDIWAFGCVLYEMLTAKRAFDGETVNDMLAKIDTSEPDLNLLPRETPSSIRFLLTATLNKNVQQRLQHIGDMPLFLDEKFFPRAASNALVAARKKTSRKTHLGALIIAALIGALIPSLVYFWGPTLRVSPEMRFDVTLPDVLGTPSISPDGQQVAYISEPADGSRAIWIRPIGSQTARKIAGTDGLNAGLIWSPDSENLAFFADGKWKKLNIVNGSIQVIRQAQTPGRGFAWNRNGVILVPTSVGDNVIARVSEGGGELKPVTALDHTQKEIMHATPVFLPDGNHFLYTITSLIPENSGLFVGSLDGKMKTRLMALPDHFNGLAYAPPGYLLISTTDLTAQRFDARRFTVHGEPAILASGIQPGFSVSDDGVLIYRKSSSGPPLRQLTWFDRTGKDVGHLGPTGEYGDLEISPAGDRVALDITANDNRDIWVIDMARGLPSRITFEGSSDWNPLWSPDASRLVYASAKSEISHLFVKSSTGAGNEELALQTDKTDIPADWSRDGRYIVFSRQQSSEGRDIWLLDTAQKKTLPFAESPFDKTHAKISPDNRWIAYASNDTGIYQIVIQSFPNPNGGKWQISVDGGMEPKWSRDGHELYYVAYDGKLMALPVKGDRVLEVGTPEPLFETPITVNRAQQDGTRRYDVGPDGRFLFAVPLRTENSNPPVAFVNWATLLDKK